MSKEEKLILLNGLFVAGMLIANFVGGKLMALGPFIISVGTPIMSLTFLCTDIISDVWGKKAAQRAIKLGFIANVVALLYTRLAIKVGYPSYWMGQEEFARVFGSQWRLVAASLTSYLISQYVDVSLFHSIKNRTGEKKLWLRNNTATIISQAMDTIVFTLLAFGGLVPVSGIVSLMASQYGLRVIIALLDTPFCYLGVRWARDSEEEKSLN